MIKITETKIHSVNKNKFEELKVSFLIKKEDYTSEIEQQLFQLSRDGNLGVLAFQSTEIWNQLDRNILLRDLQFFMERYIEKIGGNLEKEKQRLYKKYEIDSRARMTLEQLQYEIDSYKTGINYEE